MLNITKINFLFLNVNAPTSIPDRNGTQKMRQQFLCVMESRLHVRNRYRHEDHIKNTNKY